ncbi:sensor histidine kinase [Duganella violaceipulchra]|uniref:histidine kinase n=1 Tax=Duganella violaceipulchra TaxID=2849652 RepID=A0AA41HC56_9BURK|nr:ATP-binding protein [Duganella violaceicalia]MBV6321456.1 two-component sensor histidine kinase [Duganella violaceicalia]MCP2008286.1 two-component system sensor histidine kinase QseC [Duganella violaceicalia]
MTAQRSLFRRLLGGFLAVVILVWLAVVAMAIYENTVLQARHTAAENRGWTRQILLNLRSVAHDPAEVARVAAQVEALRADMLREVNYWPKPVMLQVWLHGQRVYRSGGELPGAHALPAPHDPSLGADWSSATATDAASGVVVRRDAMHDTNWLLTSSGAAYYLTPLLYSLPLLALPAWLIVRRGLRPVQVMVAEIERRSGSDLQPLPPSGYRELAPLAASVNGLMHRLTERVERDREFLSDAAHALKTPLSVIRANAHLLLNHRHDADRLLDADRGLRLGVDRATHTVHQLLALERARSDAADGDDRPIDLLHLLRERLAHAAPLAMQRGVEIELDAEAPCVLPLHRESLVAMLDNVIDNAVKYSPDGGRIAVTLASVDGVARLAIADQGPGIAPELRGKVFERFYRIPGQEQPGSGLGLAIAERAAARNGARIALEDGGAGNGLTVSVTFASKNPA